MERIERDGWMREERNNREIRGGEEQKGPRAAEVLLCYPAGFKQSRQTCTLVAMVTEPQVCPPATKGQLLKQQKLRT